MASYLTQSNDKVLQKAITYKTSFDAVTEPGNIESSSNVSHHSGKIEKPQSHKTDTCSKLSHREVERPLTTQELVNILMHSRKDHLPEWKLTQFDGNPLNWHEWFGQFISTIDSAILSDNEKLTYLKRLVVGKTKSAIAEFSYSGVLHKDALVSQSPA